MTEDRDLLPWILGAFSIAGVALAAAVGLSGRTTPAQASMTPTPGLPRADLAAADLAPAAASPAAPGREDHTAPTTAQASALPPGGTSASVTAFSSQIAGTPPPPAAAGTQIWECITNGIKTFSTNRCGDAAVRRDVGPINVMDASPAVSNVHWYEPDSNDASEYYYPSASEAADNSYPAVVGVPYLERRRPGHPHPSNNHDHGRPRHN